MTADELKSVLSEHLLWLKGEGGKCASLQCACLQRANLQGVCLRGADLRGACLQGACLRDTDLRDTDLRDTDLRDTDLRDASLQCACLQRANLQGVCLRDTDLRGADLRDTDLQDARLPHFQLPAGELLVWKKVAGKLVELRIPKEAKRTAALVGRKCRAEYAEVLSIEGGGDVETRGVTYHPGGTVRPDSYDDDPRVECTHGIHFFLTLDEAKEWT